MNEWKQIGWNAAIERIRVESDHIIDKEKIPVNKGELTINLHVMLDGLRKEYDITEAGTGTKSKGIGSEISSIVDGLHKFMKSSGRHEPNKVENFLTELQQDLYKVRDKVLA